MSEGEKIIQINIENEMKSAYIDYSMSVIVSRALPGNIMSMGMCVGTRSTSDCCRSKLLMEGT